MAQIAKIHATLLLGVSLTPHEIGQRLKHARDALHWTQMEFAHHAGVSISTVQRWEGGGLPPVRELIRVAHVLGIDPEELVEPLPVEPSRSELLDQVIALLQETEAHVVARLDQIDAELRAVRAALGDSRGG